MNGEHKGDGAVQASSAGEVPRLGFDEDEIAAIIGMSVAWLRKDRRTARQIPFFRLGSCVRYNLDRVREALVAIEVGGQRSVSRTRAAGRRPGAAAA